VCQCPLRAWTERACAVTFLLLLFVYRLVDPIVIAAGIVPYFGIRNAPWRSLAGAAVAGAFMGVVYGTATISSPIAFASSVLATTAAACVWWSSLHFGYMIAKGRAQKERDDSRRPRLVRDEDDWRR
jgi:dihydroorotate dehydrogenase